MARVLVVEDDVILRYVLAEWLRTRGYEVLEASSGEVPVIMVSGNPSLEKIHEIGIAQFFQKPYDLDKVTACIARLLLPQQKLRQQIESGCGEVPKSTIRRPPATTVVAARPSDA